MPLRAIFATRPRSIRPASGSATVPIARRLTGTAFRTNVASLPGTFVLKSGTPKTYVKTAESGNKRAHGFCPDCGTPLYATSTDPNPTSYGLRVGGLDQRTELPPPSRQGWCQSALSWSMNIEGVSRTGRQ